MRREIVVWFKPKVCAAVVNLADRETVSSTSRSLGFVSISAILGREDSEMSLTAATSVHECKEPGGKSRSNLVSEFDV